MKQRDKHKPWYVSPEDRKAGTPVARFFHAHPDRNSGGTRIVGDAFLKAQMVTGHKFLEFGKELMEILDEKDLVANGCTIAILGDQIGVAFCSHKDMFSYNRGRLIAFGRMQKPEFRVNIGGEIQKVV